MPHVPTRPRHDTPYEREHERSLERRMERGRMPRDLPGLLRWMAEQWELEVPDAIQAGGDDVWHGRQEVDPRTGAPRWEADLVGGSKLGTPRDRDPFRRFLENSPSEVDADGFFVRPMHAAVARLGRRWPLMARNLVAVAHAGWDWRGVAERGHWAAEMYEVYLEAALRRLWNEFGEQRVVH
jgi:hypothetical protein